MEKIIRKKIGNETHVFTVTGKNLFELQMEAQKLSFFDIPKCGNCGKDSLYLKAYVTKEDNYKYIKIVCRDCWYTLTFGQVKTDPDTFYLRRKKDTRGNYTKEYDWQPPPDQKAQSLNQAQQNKGNESGDGIPDPTEDDMPF